MNADRAESGERGRQGAPESASGYPSDPPAVSTAQNADLRERVRALVRSLVDSGDVTPQAQRQINAVMRVLPPPAPWTLASEVASKPGPDWDGGAELTDAEFEAFRATYRGDGESSSEAGRLRRGIEALHQRRSREGVVAWCSACHDDWPCDTIALLVGRGGQAQPEQAGGGASLIAAERRRQVEVEGYSPEHDTEHAHDDLALVAALYALPERRRFRIADVWPWEPSAWKPTPDDRVRELTKAGALIAAEIDRLLAGEPQPEAGG